MPAVIVTEIVAYTGTAARSAAQPVNSVRVITCSTDAWIRFGGSAVDAAAATANNIFMRAGVPREFDFKGTNLYVSAIQDAAGGEMVIETWS